MPLQVQFEVTSEHPCQIPGLGTFEGGDTIEVDDFLRHNFKAHNGVDIVDANFTRSVTLRAILTDVPESGEEATA
jgi:hypothetical protein